MCNHLRLLLQNSFEDIKLTVRVENRRCSHSLKPGLRMVVTIAEHVCDYVPNSVLKLLKCRLQIFLVKDHYLDSLQLYRDQAIPGKHKNVCGTMCLRSLQPRWRPGLKRCNFPCTLSSNVDKIFIAICRRHITRCNLVLQLTMV